MKPLGYYVSVPEGHQDYQALKDLELKYGSFFEALPLYELKRNLWLASKWCFNNVEYGLWDLSSQVSFDLIPFIHQVIKERLVKDATN